MIMIVLVYKKKNMSGSDKCNGSYERKRECANLKKLEDAKLVYSTKEQYYVVYHLDQEILSLSLRDLVHDT